MRKIKPSQLGEVLKGLGEMAGEDYKDFLRKLSIDAYANLVRISAVDTGYMRGAWEVAVDTIPPNESHSGKGKGKGKGKHGRPGVPSLTNIKLDSNVVIYNNSSYAENVDQGTETKTGKIVRAQPMIEPTRQRVLSEAIKVSKALSKVVYNV